MPPAEKTARKQQGAIGSLQYKWARFGLTHCHFRHTKLERINRNHRMFTLSLERAEATPENVGA